MANVLIKCHLVCIILTMNFETLVKKRRATHHFDPNFKLSDEKFKKLIEVTRFAPSGYNAQPWKFILIRDLKSLEKISTIAFGQKHVIEAGNVIVVIGHTKIVEDPDHLLQDWVRYGYCTEDKVPTYKHTFTKHRAEGRLRQMALRNGAIVAATLLYAAEDMGFSTCPMMGFSQPQLAKFLELPRDYIPILLVPIGKGIPEKEKPQLPRKEVDDLIFFEKFGKKL